jgi:hypothetical protein
MHGRMVGVTNCCRPMLLLILHASQLPAVIERFIRILLLPSPSTRRAASLRASNVLPRPPVDSRGPCCQPSRPCWVGQARSLAEGNLAEPGSGRSPCGLCLTLSCEMSDRADEG